jgi:hypothetical protein
MRRNIKTQFFSTQSHLEVVTNLGINTTRQTCINTESNDFIKKGISQGLLVPTSKNRKLELNPRRLK